MNKLFEHFPEDEICPLCGTNDDKECCLIPIDGTGDSEICAAAPMHVECVTRIEMFRYVPENIQKEIDRIKKVADI